MIVAESEKDTLKDVLYDCLTSSKAMANVFFKHHCYRPFGAAHDPIFETLDNDKIHRALIVCPRGWGKTTLAGLIFPAKKILFRDVNYIVYISATVTKAINDLQTLAAELQTNDTIKKLFGNVKGVRWAEGSGELVVNVLGKDIYIDAKGAGSQIRGLKHGQYRPDLYIIDDLEDKETVMNEERRDKLKRWFFSDVLNSEDLQGARVVMMGTLLHEDSLVANILDEEKWESNFDELEEKKWFASEKFVSVRIEACDDKFNSTWPEYMPSERIKAKALAYEKRGMLDEFYRELRNLIVPTQGATFSQQYFKYYKEDWQELRKIDNVVIVDPAKTTNLVSADSAITGVGFDGAKNKIYFRDCFRGKLHPEQIYKEACDMADRLDTYVVGIEVTSLNEFITYPFRAYIATRKKHYELVELKARGKKEERIKALSPFYRLGCIYHNEDQAIRGPLEAQLLVFPNGKLVDVIDSFAYCVEMFDLGERLFSIQPDDENETDPFKKAKMQEDEFETLKSGDYDKPFEGWANA